MRIDAHHHFWNSGRRDLAWLTQGREPIARSYGPTELEGELRVAGVDRTVLVQASNTADETERVLRAATMTEYVAGAVAWAPLHRPYETATVLARCRTHPKFRGFRHVTTRDSDISWLLDKPAVASLRLIAQAGATFDVVPAGPEQLRTVIALADRLPELDIVIDHLGRPPVHEHAWEPWASLMEKAAMHPRIHVKVSVGFDLLNRGWQWSAERLRPYVEHTTTCFGPQRLMIASNWPVSLLGATYGEVWATAAKLVAPLTMADRGAVLGGTAARFYHLDEKVHE